MSTWRSSSPDVEHGAARCPVCRSYVGVSNPGEKTISQLVSGALGYIIQRVHQLKGLGEPTQEEEMEELLSLFRRVHGSPSEVTGIENFSQMFGHSLGESEIVIFHMDQIDKSQVDFSKQIEFYRSNDLLDSEKEAVRGLLQKYCPQGNEYDEAIENWLLFYP